MSADISPIRCQTTSAALPHSERLRSSLFPTEATSINLSTPITQLTLHAEVLQAQATEAAVVEGARGRQRGQGLQEHNNQDQDYRITFRRSPTSGSELTTAPTRLMSRTIFLAA